MAGKRHEGDRACRCHRDDASCAALTVRRLSHERVREPAEEIWTASGGDEPPLLCVHGRGGRLAGPPSVVGDVRVANPRELPDVVRHGLRAQEDEAGLAIDRLLEVLRPAV